MKIFDWLCKPCYNINRPKQIYTLKEAKEMTTYGCNESKKSCYCSQSKVRYAGRNARHRLHQKRPDDHHQGSGGWTRYCDSQDGVLQEKQPVQLSLSDC